MSANFVRKIGILAQPARVYRREDHFMLTLEAKDIDDDVEHVCRQPPELLDIKLGLVGHATQLS